MKICGPITGVSAMMTTSAFAIGSGARFEQFKRIGWLAILFVATLAASSPAQTKIVGWGLRGFDSSFNDESFAEVHAGGYLTAARRADGTFAAWGAFSSPLLQSPSLPAGVSFVSFSAGGKFCIALRSDGHAVGWPASIPAANINWSSIAQLAAGDQHSLGLLSNGQITAQGDNMYGQCQVPPLPLGMTYTQIAAGKHHSLAIRSDGQIIAWGDNNTGQCNAPPAPAGLSFVEITAGEFHSVARLSDGSVVAWGLPSLLNVPALPAGLTYVEISAGSDHTLALRSDGSAVGWADPFTFGAADVPASPPGMTYTHVSAGGVVGSGGYCHSAVLRSDGRVVCFGWNGYSELNAPPLAPGLSYVDVDSGCGGYDNGGAGAVPCTLALRSDGTIAAWGDPSVGQLDVPALPSGLKYVEIAAGGAHNVARRSDGTLVAWGENAFGQLNGVPTPPPGLTYVQIGAGSYHSLARRSDGTIQAFGNATGGGQLLNVPVLPPGLTYTGMAVGQVHSLALRSDGAVVAWGSNTYGQLNVPALPPGVTYVEVAAGGSHSLARRSDGALVTWGYSGFGLLEIPTLPPGVTFVEISAAMNGSAALLSDGTIRIWGTTGAQTVFPPLAPGQRFVHIRLGEDAIAALVDTVWSSYCTAKTNSLGCTPAINAVGEPHASLSSGFRVQCSQARNQKLGLLLYTVNGSQGSTPFQCGTLCIGPAGLKRAPSMSSGGSATGDDCSGLYSIDMNAFAAGAAGGNPAPELHQPGTLVHAQWWGRDPGFAPPCNTMLSDAIQYIVEP
jgi:alpha-tubulin suppressor-like RCC1 family protein